MAPDTRESAAPVLKDATLLRQQCYVNGAWIDARGGATNAVTDPATGRTIGTVASLVDVTDRKVQEEHLRIVLRELARGHLPGALLVAE